MSRKVLKYILSRTLKPAVGLYIKKPRYYRLKDIRVRIEKGVFHPGLFFSTKLLIGYLEKMELKGKRILELGAGSGLISIFCAKKGASVFASDLSKTAFENMNENFISNKVEVISFHSDLFEKIPQQQFDLIIINPPYYKKNPINDSEYAWYCGENGEYFVKLFNQLPVYINKGAEAIMILNSECDLHFITQLASFNQLYFRLRKKINNLLETNYIFEISDKSE